MQHRFMRSLVFGTLCLSMATTLSAQDKIQSTLAVQSESVQSSKNVQRRVDDLDDQAREMLNDYRQTMSQATDLAAYNHQLEQLVTVQRAELAGFEVQFKNIETTKRRILPLIVRMIEVLDEFVAMDIPFLDQERSLRIAELKKLMARPEVPTSEKYRRVTEAYQIELEYGHTIEAYEGEIDTGDETRTVAFLRYGRLGLYYMTLDGQEIGYWDKRQDRWLQLGDEYRQSLDRAMRIARKQLPPDLTRLPVPAPEEKA